ncbi:PREDICTED: acyl-CoA-binding domain-containing protein 4 [Nelumbo nucifera]|uniref:Acyl-CoA-binding domain-containing protein 4 n=1 Tax=Nelumbo nucifera TaxID=4432 RepID=A0A1U8AVM5_NELNU|nr:PREDICTED: acyl-CoA-binding domain-containing protein 4 [Nelumbo nucifera]XP_010267285.1 PREDICTED: acyl-CoA-binding domain-containing protein 4 [Nelumbo nucifera]XP_010267286.1 PREDICTED: acyl-CoA-binding domain-containing protein 4 [Nelumbo nucifera]
MGIEEINVDSDIKDWHLSLAYDQWVQLPVTGSRPPARYKHAAEVVDEKLYIAGGSRNGRYLSDIQVLDLRTLAWSKLKLYMDSNPDNLEDSSLLSAFPAISGHSMIKWGRKLLLLGGHSKDPSDYVVVRMVDLETNHYSILKTSGKIPRARGGQSITVSGCRLIMFGGEDASRQLLNDIYILDLETMTWDIVETTQTPPAPRFDHTAAVHAERYLLVFGGCSHLTCFNDLHLLDLQTMEWSQPQIQGDTVNPRAAHASVTLDENWYIVGGGDNKNGASEALVLNMSKLVWSVLTSVKERDPLASEGISLCSTIINGEKFLVAFGGYNGKYNNEVFVLRPKLKDSLRPKIFQSPAAAAAAASVTAAYALTTKTELDFTNTEDSNYEEVQMKNSKEDFTAEINAITEEKKMLESSLTKVREENSKLQGSLNEMNNTHAELSKELISVQGQLASERSRCFKLEAQISELQKMLESLQSIEDEVQVLRNQKSALEQQMELASASQRQGSGGIWQWIAGSTPNS